MEFELELAVQSEDYKIIARQLEEIKRIKQVNETRIEYWTGRDISEVLGYSNWQNFVKVIDKAKNSCEGSGKAASNHFIDTSNMVEIGSSAKRNQRDFILSRYACYLVAMNGDTTKARVAAAQTYFAVQTRKQEKFDELSDDEKRIALRERVRGANNNLNGAAKDAGVSRFGLFHDAGYRGLYGMGLKDIKDFKGLVAKEDLLDRSGRAELAANEFRITQTEEKLNREQVKGEQRAINTHREVGLEVRKTIEKIGGTLPENLKPEPSIKKLASRIKKENKELNQ